MQVFYYWWLSFLIKMTNTNIFINYFNDFKESLNIVWLSTNLNDFNNEKNIYYYTKDFEEELNFEQFKFIFYNKNNFIFFSNEWNIWFFNNIEDIKEKINLDFDVCFFNISSNVDELIKKFSCKTILPIYNNKEEMENKWAEFAREIMINNFSIPKVIKPWQYILV